MKASEDIRKNRGSHTPRGLLPLKDVPTRWNSAEAAIRRVLRLKKNMQAFCARYKHERCPQFTHEYFAALELLQPALAIFLILTNDVFNRSLHKLYREHGVTPRDEGSQGTSHLNRVDACSPGLAPQCRAEIGKHIRILLGNNKVGAAFALDPFNKGEALKNILEAYGKGSRCATVEQ